MLFTLTHDGREVQGLLVGFCRHKLSIFQEPERKGTPKGDPIGFGRKKYHCALLGMTNLSLIEISTHADVSYGLLRKWNHEQDFKDRVEGFVKDFINELSYLMNKRQLHAQAVGDRLLYGDRIRIGLLNLFNQKASSTEGLDLNDINYYLMLFAEREKRKISKGGMTKDVKISKEVSKVLRETDRMIFNRLVKIGENILKRETLHGKGQLERVFSYLRRIHREGEKT